MTDKKYLSKMIQMIMLGLTSVAATTLLHAAEETTQNNAEPLALPTLKFTANQLGEITENSGVYTPGSIATATRLVLKPKETPQTISVITRQEMDDFNLNSIDDVMRHTPGVSVVTYDSERTEYYSRGFAIQNFQYDGIPMNRDSAYSAGNTLSDMAIYDRIEVLKGATGLLTGVGDPGATINLIRKKPTKDFQGNVSLGLGTWNNYRGQIDLSGPLNETGSIRARGVAAYQDKESQLDRYERKTPVFYGILEADLTDNTLLTVGADYQDNKPKGSTWGGIPIYNSAGQFNKMPRGFNNGANWSNWEQYTRTIFSTLEHKFDNDWVAKIQLNHQINGYDAQLGAAAGGHPNPSTGTGVSMWAGNYKGETKSDAADIYATGPFQLFGREHELVVGASISESTWKNNGYGTPTDYKTSVDQYYQWNGNVAEPDWQRGNHWSNNETTKQNGFYLTSRLNLHDDLKVILGGRIANYKSEETKESGIFIPYVGAVYDLNDQYSVYASYSTIFKPQSAQNPNGKTLDPLEGENYEAGIKGEFFDGRLNASLAYYQLKQDNFAKEIPNVLTPSGGVASEALQGVKTKGAELEVTGEIRPGWNLHAGFNHKISKQDGIKQSTLTPENEFSLYTSYKLNQWVDGLTIGGGARWQDKTWGDVTNPLYKDPVKHVVSDYWLFDAMANYEVNDQLSVSFNVNNLLDEKYYTIFSWYSTYTWGEGRNYNLGLKYKF
ncbi:TonB-dependent siderophore receptor [Acinetobacter guillouiae]|uniref:TonB-dependent siderophore receptor n=1 Tax=Acinetobacter TaxID=469 RepID=UPI001D1726E4|nr:MULTISPECIES: TonB-dependent siderophore receptor [Acinetobacter]MCS4298022.1 outer membrane receptor for ferric coprogen and ferric-rhodotorulic acid [Acinetobacter guillouiae]MCW2251626.1 outer membrane receptor for ferric coprogen and ferric-rhodotorulic acid [Acinetobacter sp. BIGb0204]NII35876.1 outer membrane receptor for ferric coprogen and ferric-rhodotorulic acid [Acinetobacter sp. BIGb0196]